MRGIPDDSSFEAAIRLIQTQFPGPVHCGIVLGTGAGDLAKSIRAESVIDYGQIPGFPHSTALGHKGQLVCGQLAGRRVIALQGRFHLYEGYSFDHVTFPIHVLARLGIRQLALSNAAGGLNPKMNSGDLMAIESHIDWMATSSTFLWQDSVVQRPGKSGNAYCPHLIQGAIACGRRLGFAVHPGVYAAMLGPNYETRAEYRFLRKIGADVAGMSTVPEALVASHYGIEVLAISVVTNVANPDSLVPTSGKQVIQAAEVAAPNLNQVVIDAVSRVPIN